MSALNFKPNNSMALAALGIGALWFFSRRAALAAPRPGVTTQPVAGPGSSFAGGLSTALNALGGLLRSGEAAAQTVAREAGAAAVKAGDPYYGGDDSIAGSWAAWSTQAQADFDAWNATVGTADDLTGDPYNY